MPKSPIHKRIRQSSPEISKVVVDRGSLGALLCLFVGRHPAGQFASTNKRFGFHQINRGLPLVFINGGLARLPGSALFRSLKSCLGSFADQIALKLRQSGHYVIKEASHSGSGVNAFSEALKLNAALFQFFGKPDQFFQVAAKAVKLPHNKYIAFPKVLKGLHELRAVFANARRKMMTDEEFTDVSIGTLTMDTPFTFKNAGNITIDEIAAILEVAGLTIFDNEKGRETIASLGSAARHFSKPANTRPAQDKADD